MNAPSPYLPRKVPEWQKNGVALPELVDFLLKNLHFLPETCLFRLREALSVPQLEGSPSPDAEYGDINLSGEVASMFNATKRLREAVLGANNEKIDLASAKDAKDVLMASKSLLDLLIKTEQEVKNMDRLRAVELAVLEVLEDVDPAVQQRFVEAFKKRFGVA